MLASITATPATSSTVPKQRRRVHEQSNGQRNGKREERLSSSPLARVKAGQSRERHHRSHEEQGQDTEK